MPQQRNYTEVGQQRRRELGTFWVLLVLRSRSTSSKYIQSPHAVLTWHINGETKTCGLKQNTVLKICLSNAARLRPYIRRSIRPQARAIVPKKQKRRFRSMHRHVQSSSEETVIAGPALEGRPSPTKPTNPAKTKAVCKLNVRMTQPCGNLKYALESSTTLLSTSPGCLLHTITYHAIPIENKHRASAVSCLSGATLVREPRSSQPEKLDARLEKFRGSAPRQSKGVLPCRLQKMRSAPRPAKKRSRASCMILHPRCQIPLIC